MIFDTHAHYDDERFDEDREGLLVSMRDKGVGNIVNVGASMKGCKDSVALARKYPFVYAAVGIHPSECGDMDENDLSWLKKACDDEKVVAVGEIGLDYYWPEPSKDIQKKWFVRQLDIAVEKQMPVIIHSRDAASDTLSILKEYSHKLKSCIIHCYSYSPEIAMEYVSMGFYIGIGGVLTFKNGKKLKETASLVPLDRILLETDCPYMAPEPVRGSRNDSSNIIYVAKELAVIKGVDVDEVIDITCQNAARFYGI